MKEKTRLVELSSKELAYLKSSGFLPEALRRILEKGKVQEGGRCLFSLSIQEAEEFRSIFTDRLAKVGFDEDYQITSEGQMLEDLIDRFFIEKK